MSMDSNSPFDFWILILILILILIIFCLQHGPARITELVSISHGSIPYYTTGNIDKASDKSAYTVLAEVTICYRRRESSALPSYEALANGEVRSVAGDIPVCMHAPFYFPGLCFLDIMLVAFLLGAQHPCWSLLSYPLTLSTLECVRPG